MNQPPVQPSGQVNVNKRKRPFWLTALFGLIGLCLVIGVLGQLIAPKGTQTGSGNQSTSSGSSQVQNTSVPAATQPVASDPQVTIAPTVETAPTVAAPQSTELTVGSTGESNGLKVTLNEVRQESSGNIAPKNGQEYLILNLTFENTTKDKKSISSLLNFNVKDDTGQKYNIAFGAKTKSSADGSIAAGDKLRGESAFEVPIDVKGLVFVFDPVFGGDALRFKLDK